MKRLNINKEKLEIILLIALIFLITIVSGLSQIETSDFIPINGDFQNYNPVRRFLSGQTPFQDFAVYLGSGHLIILSAVQLLIGNDFTKSMFAANFVTTLMLQLTVFAIAFLIMKNKKKALYVTLLFSILRFINISFLDSDIAHSISFGFLTGNSARMIRIAIVTIMILTIYISNKIINNSKINNKPLVKKIGLAILSGAAILYSNDGGIATYITISFLYFLLLIKQYKKDIKSIIKYTLLYIGISIISLLVIATIITRGNPLSWLEYNFGVSQYQKWYYDVSDNKLNISLLDAGISIYTILMIIQAVYYVIKMFKKNDETIRYFLISIITIVPVVSTYLYRFMSGGIADEMLRLVLIIQLTTYLLTFIKFNKLWSKILKVSVLLIAGILSISSLCNVTGKIIENGKNYAYVDGLKGSVKIFGNALNRAAEKIGNEKIFSTYAAPLETITNQFQPSGIDYIIHALGDKQREQYLKKFREGNFKWFVDVENYNLFYYWCRNANWFLYREMYKDYKPAYSIAYYLFYEKENDNDPSPNVNIKLERKDDCTYVIELETNDKSYDGIADVKISYNSQFKKGFFNTLDINRYVSVNDITTRYMLSSRSGDKINYNIPNISDEYYIPITIINGEGKVEIYSKPDKNTFLEIENAEIMDVYNVMFKYFDINHIEENKLYVEDLKKNEVILEEVKAIQAGDVIMNVTKIEKIDDCIVLTVDGNISEFSIDDVYKVIK